MAAYTTTADGVRMRILSARAAPGEGGQPGTLLRDRGGWSVACGRGVLVLETVQLNRGKGTRITVASAANGYPRVLFGGARLGDFER